MSCGPRSSILIVPFVVVYGRHVAFATKPVQQRGQHNDDKRSCSNDHIDCSSDGGGKPAKSMPFMTRREKSES